MKIQIFAALLSVGVLLACQSNERADSEPEEANVLKEYVDVPRDRANSAKDKVEAAQGAVQRQADGLADE